MSGTQRLRGLERNRKNSPKRGGKPLRGATTDACEAPEELTRAALTRKQEKTEPVQRTRKTEKGHCTGGEEGHHV